MKLLQKSVYSSRQGYTLVELLIYFGLVSIMFLQLTNLFLAVLDSKKDINALSGVERDGQYIFARVVFDIERADSISTPATLGATSNSLQLTIGGVPYLYQVTNNALTLTRNGQVIPLHYGTTVSDFTVQRLGNVGGKHTIKLQYRLTSPIQESRGQESQVYQTTVGLR